MARVGEIESATKPLGERLRARIRREGPISFHDWMSAALYDPVDGYYCRADRIRQGRAGDYRTAPESSPLFAATFAGCFARLFVELGSPRQWTIFEAGGGTGHFALGLLKSLQSRHAAAFTATNYVIDEVSTEARSQAAKLLSEYGDRVTFRQLDEVRKPVTAGLVFSNELIDAFPVHRVTTCGGMLRELCVGLEQDDFVWRKRDLDPLIGDYCRRTNLDLSEGQIAELNLDAEHFVSQAAAVLQTGFVVTVDYGAERDELLSARHRAAGTLRAFHRHQLKDPLSNPGEQDLTTTIDWTQIKEAGERAGLQTVRHQRLDRFLLHEGILDELETQAVELSDVEALRLRTTAREMIMPNGLTASFQVLIQKKTGLNSWTPEQSPAKRVSFI